MRLHIINPFNYLQQELLTRMGMGPTPASAAVSALAGLLCIPGPYLTDLQHKGTKGQRKERTSG